MLLRPPDCVQQEDPDFAQAVAAILHHDPMLTHTDRVTAVLDAVRATRAWWGGSTVEQRVAACTFSSRGLALRFVFV